MIPANHEAHMKVLLEGIAAEHRIQVAHLLVVAVDLDNTLTNARALLMSPNVIRYKVGTGKHVQLLVRPQHGDVGDVFGKRLVVGLEERILVLHVFQQEVRKVDVLHLVEIGLLVVQLLGNGGVLSHIAGHDELLWNLHDHRSSFHIFLHIHSTEL